jgi:hypothetical protein
VKNTIRKAVGITHKKVSIRSVSVTDVVFVIFTLNEASLYTCETTPVCKKSPGAELLKDGVLSPLVKVSSQTPALPL